MNWPEGPTPSWVKWAEDYNYSNEDVDKDIAEREKFPDLMTSQEAGQYLGASKDWANALARQGKLAVVRIGRFNYFYKVDLAVYLAEKGRGD